MDRRRGRGKGGPGGALPRAADAGYLRRRMNLVDPLRPLGRADLPADTEALARFLIGKALVRAGDGAGLVGRIVETEAYPPGDPASHAFRGPTRRCAAMFLEPGRAYVYIAYGCWPVLNVTSEAAGIGAAVLLRAVEPLIGDGPRQAASGPGRLARLFGVTPALDGADLCGGGPLALACLPGPAPAVAASPRIGISKAAERRLRFFEPGNACVSGPARLNRPAG